MLSDSFWLWITLGSILSSFAIASYAVLSRYLVKIEESLKNSYNELYNEFEELQKKYKGVVPIANGKIKFFTPTHYMLVEGEITKYEYRVLVSRLPKYLTELDKKSAKKNKTAYKKNSVLYKGVKR